MNRAGMLSAVLVAWTASVVSLSVYSVDKWDREICEAITDQPEKVQCHQRLDDIEKEIKERAAENERIARERHARATIYGEKCGRDIGCWVREKSNKLKDLQALASCQRLIEAHAKYQFRWTDGWGELKFPRYHGLDQEKYPFVVGYAGDAVQFQNGFSAWRPYSYRCWYDYGTEQVLSVDLKEGKGWY